MNEFSLDIWLDAYGSLVDMGLLQSIRVVVPPLVAAISVAAFAEQLKSIGLRYAGWGATVAVLLICIPLAISWQDDLIDEGRAARQIEIDRLAESFDGIKLDTREEVQEGMGQVEALLRERFAGLDRDDSAVVEVLVLLTKIQMEQFERLERKGRERREGSALDGELAEGDAPPTIRRPAVEGELHAKAVAVIRESEMEDVRRDFDEIRDSIARLLPALSIASELANSDFSSTKNDLNVAKTGIAELRSMASDPPPIYVVDPEGALGPPLENALVQIADDERVDRDTKSSFADYAACVSKRRAWSLNRRCERRLSDRLAKVEPAAGAGSQASAGRREAGQADL